MKIGILTFHCAHNYGAVLQAYGLQEYLKSLGHNVEVVDYRPNYLIDGYLPIPPTSLRGISLKRKILRLGYWGLHLPFRILRLPMTIPRRRGFEDFINNKLNLSKHRFSHGNAIEETYDAIVFGSDQIWSPNHTNKGDSIFLGDFKTPAGTLKIAYAASAGASSEKLAGIPAFVNALKNFDAISVREEILAKTLQSETPLKIETVLDPTLLVDKSVWEKIAVSPKVKEKYVLVYQVTYNPDADRIAKELAKQINAKVVSIWAGYTNRFGMLRTETPEQFVGWFKNAECVVTTSFHGTAFSLIFDKPLYYVGNGNAAENRPKQILSALGLMDRYILGNTHPKFSPLNSDKMSQNGGGYFCLAEKLSRIPRRRSRSAENSVAFPCGNGHSARQKQFYFLKNSSPCVPAWRVFSRPKGMPHE